MADKTEDLSWDTESQIILRACSEEARGEPGYIGVFAPKDQVVGTSKDYCSSKKTRHLKLMNFTLFCVWEDAKVWAHRNHSFDLHLIYLGWVSYVFTP